MFNNERKTGSGGSRNDRYYPLLCIIAFLLASIATSLLCLICDLG